VAQFYFGAHMLIDLRFPPGRWGARRLASHDLALGMLGSALVVAKAILLLGHASAP
jgi:hypothetical protein